jgi:hypothetical protein
MFPWASKKGKSTSNLEEDVGFPEEMSSGSERRLRALSGAGGGIPLEPPNLEPLPAATRSKRSGSMPFLMVAPPPLSQIAEGGGGDEGADLLAAGGSGGGGSGAADGAGAAEVDGCSDMARASEFRRRAWSGGVGAQSSVSGIGMRPSTVAMDGANFPSSSGRERAASTTARPSFVVGGDVRASRANGSRLSVNGVASGGRASVGRSSVDLEAPTMIPMAPAATPAGSAPRRARPGLGRSASTLANLAASDQPTQDNECAQCHGRAADAVGLPSFTVFFICSVSVTFSRKASGFVLFVRSMCAVAPFTHPLAARVVYR